MSGLSGAPASSTKILMKRVRNIFPSFVLTFSVGERRGGLRGLKVPRSATGTRGGPLPAPFAGVLRARVSGPPPPPSVTPRPPRGKRRGDAPDSRARATPRAPPFPTHGAPGPGRPSCRPRLPAARRTRGPGPTGRPRPRALYPAPPPRVRRGAPATHCRAPPARSGRSTRAARGAPGRPSTPGVRPVPRAAGPRVDRRRAHQGQDGGAEPRRHGRRRRRRPGALSADVLPRRLPARPPPHVASAGGGAARPRVEGGAGAGDGSPEGGPSPTRDRGPSRGAL